MNPRDASEGSGSLSSTDLELLQHFVEDAQALFNAPRGIGRRASGMTAPLSFAQKRLWFLAQLEPDKPIYNVRLMARLRGTLHLGAFHASFQEVVRRHEILRTTFEVDGYEPVQIIQPSVHIHFPLIDLSGLSSQEQQIYLHKLIREETQHAFDLTRGPLFKGLLLQIGSQEHIFFLKLHHIITDGWSRGVLLQELGALYEAFIAGKPSPLPELPIQYADFAAWQRQQFQENYLSSELEYWRQQLADAPPLLELPLDRPRPPVQRYAGATLTVPFSPSLTSALNALSRREGVTLFMTLLAAFQALLARFCGQEDIPVGAFIANRLHKELEGLIGFFVNILVLRTNLSGNPSFRELLQRVRQTALAAYAHQDLPFEKLVEELHPERNLSYHPLIQVMFQLDNTPLPSFQVAQLSLEPVEFEKETSPFDLSLLLSETKQGLHAFVEYSTDLFEEATILRLLTHYQTLLARVTAEPDRRLNDMLLLSGAEQDQLLVEWNATHTPYPDEARIHHFFEKQVLLTPDAPAVHFENQCLSYQELHAWADQLASHLRQYGVGPNVPVGLYTERSLEMVVGMLGILKAGGAYVPLDPGYPSRRLSFILQDAQVSVLLTQPSLLSRLPEHQATVVLIEPGQRLPAVEGRDRHVNDGTSDDLAYIIYTSGSTGQPKGVCLPHKTLTNLLSWHQQTVRHVERTLQFAPLSFDASVHEMFAAWCVGGTIVMVPEELRQDMSGLAQFLIEQQIQKAILPVVVLQQLAEIYHTKDTLPTSLREVITTGEQLRITSVIRELFQRLKGCRLHNHYGPSETHVVTSYTLSEDPATWPTYPPIGRPIANTQVYVLDQSGQPVPVGVVGELYIGGDSLARGYLNRPNLAAERFVGPFPALGASRLYRTGDLVRYLPDGNLVFLGRRDQQTKIRGFRIELEELNSVLCKHPDIREAIVDVQGEETEEKYLVAYLVPDPQRMPVIAGRRRSTLPNNMSIICPDQAEATLLYSAIFERQTYRLQGITINDGDTIFDVGASIGLFTLWASQHGQHVRISAFEPDPAACEALQINTKLYAPQVSVYPYPPPHPGEDQIVSSSAAIAFPASVMRSQEIRHIHLLRIALPDQAVASIETIDQEIWQKVQNVLIEVKGQEDHIEHIRVFLEKQGFTVDVNPLVEQAIRGIYGTHSAIKPLSEQTVSHDASVLPTRTYQPMLTVNEMRQFLLHELPGYMVPSSFIFLEALPLNINGKVDRQALPKADTLRPELAIEYVAPRTSVEKALAAIWTKIFDIHPIGIYDNFFDLGGHSLLATLLMAQIRGNFQVDLPVRDLFEHPTIAALATDIELAQFIRSDTLPPSDDEQGEREEIVL